MSRTGGRDRVKLIKVLLEIAKFVMALIDFVRSWT